MTYRVRFSSQVDPGALDRARATVRGVRASTYADYSLAQFTEEALTAYCTRLEALYNEGRPWPTSQHALPPGRR